MQRGKSHSSLWKTEFASDGGEAMHENRRDAIATSPSELDPGSKWFAAYTATHHEKHVHQQLADRRVESFLPVYRTCREWKKRVPEDVELPLFPNYVFVRISRAQRGVVLGTPGIYSLVGSSHNAWELPKREIEALREGIKERKIEPHQYLVVGEKVRVKSGLLAGLEGVVVRRKNNLQMILSLDQIMQSVAIEVDASELESAQEKSDQRGNSPRGTSRETGTKRIRLNEFRISGDQP
jgi:transcription antitermination factor NusG